MGSSVRRVLVLAGGPDAERVVSLESGAGVAEALVRGGVECAVEVIDRPDESALRAMIAEHRSEVVFPALHGPWGEGGPLQEMLERIGVAFVGSGSAGSSAAMDKSVTKGVARELVGAHGMGVTVLASVELGGCDAGCLPFERGAVIKVVDEGSSLGVSVCVDDEGWRAARERVLGSGRSAFVEERIVGREFTVPMLEEQGGGWRSLPIVEIVPMEGSYDYEAKYARDDTRSVVDAELPTESVEAARRLTRGLAGSMALRHLCRADFMLESDSVGVRGRLVFLEVNTMPGFTAHSLFPQSASAIGLGLPELVLHLVELAARDRGGKQEEDR